MKLEKLKQQFIDNGFRIEDDSFILEKVEYTTISINGQVHKQPHTMRFEMKYVGKGLMWNDRGDSDSDSDTDETDLFEFDILNDRGEAAYSILIKNFEDFTKLT